LQHKNQQHRDENKFERIKYEVKGTLAMSEDIAFSSVLFLKYFPQNEHKLKETGLRHRKAGQAKSRKRDAWDE
jgi:hypothetical protein